MRTKKLNTCKATMMGGPLRTGVCVVICVVVVVARAAAQGRDNLRQPGGTVWPAPIRQGFGRYANGNTGATSTEAQLGEVIMDHDQGSDGALMEEDSQGTRMFVNSHSYHNGGENQPRPSPVNSHTGGGEMLWAGEATHEGPHHTLAQEQISETTSDQPGVENPESNPNGGEENKSSSITSDPSAEWTWELDKWLYQDGEWVATKLPNPAFPALPTPHLPTAALIAIPPKKVEVERDVSGMANFTLHYRYFLSHNPDPDTTPELKVYYVVDGTRHLRQREEKQGEWQMQILHMAVPNISSVLFEGWVKQDGDMVALSNVDAIAASLGQSDPLDEGDQLMLTTGGQADKTGELISTPSTEENLTQDRSTSEVVFPETELKDQENNTENSAPPADIQVKPSPTANSSQLAVEETGNVTELPPDLSDVMPWTGRPENQTKSNEEMNENIDAVTLNTSVFGGSMTTKDSGLDNITSRMTAAGNETKIDGGTSTVSAMRDSEANTSLSKPENAVDTNENVDNNTTSSLSGVTTDALQMNTNTAITPLSGGITRNPAVNSEISGNSNAAEGQAVPPDASRGDELNSSTTLGAPQPNETLMNGTTHTDVTISIEQESTTLPSAAGNNTEVVMAESVSNTSWQLFQVFLILCVLGLLALGFLYWKKKRRQDDEIPVFTRHTDYPNPTFTMEDAASFMTRGRRNTYKTLE